MARTGKKTTGAREGLRRVPRKAVLGGVVSAFVGATVVAAAGGAVIADTGPLAVGDYSVSANFGADGTNAAGKAIEIVHRNAANSGDVKVISRCPAGATGHVLIPRITLVANERLVARASTTAFAASEQATASIEAIAIPS